ncbi:hypothetical protein Tco_0522933 [Tanacetum coccineum]
MFRWVNPVEKWRRKRVKKEHVLKLVVVIWIFVVNQTFIKRTEAVYHDKAVENGSLVVLACAFDSVPAELGLMFSSRHLESAILWTTNADKLAEFRRFRLYRTPPQFCSSKRINRLTIEHQKKVGLWGVTFSSPDASVVQRTLSILADKLSGLQGVNEDPKQAEERAAFWSTIKPAHFGVKIATKNLLALFGFIAIGSSLEQLGRFWEVAFADIPFSFYFGGSKKGSPTEEQADSASFKMWLVGQGFTDANLASQMQSRILKSARG